MKYFTFWYWTDKYKSVKRAVLHFKQRRIRGFDDSETWSLDHTIADFVLPRLKRFKEVTVCYPMDQTKTEWNLKLDKMIAAFEFHSSDKKYYTAEPTEVKEGLQLFAKHFVGLWW